MADPGAGGVQHPEDGQELLGGAGPGDQGRTEQDVTSSEAELHYTRWLGSRRFSPTVSRPLN